MQSLGTAHGSPQGEPFPMVPVGDFQLVDKIFPGMPGDSLLYNSNDLKAMRFQVTMHQREESPTAESKGRNLDLSTPQGRCPVQPARMENLLNPEGSLSGPSHQRHLQTLQAESLCATTNAPLYQKSAMAPVTKTHMVPHPSIGTNPTVTGAAMTKSVASLHSNVQHPHYRCRPPPHGQRRKLA